MVTNALTPAPMRFTSGSPLDNDNFTIDLKDWMATGDTITTLPTITVVRSDGAASDVSVSAITLTGTVVGWKASGGTGSLDYTFLVAITTAARTVTMPFKYFIRPLF